MKGYIFCPGCLELKYLSRHHVFPTRFFPKQRCPPILHICRTCHDDLERKIPRDKKKAKSFYIKIVQQFIGGRRVERAVQ